MPHGSRPILALALVATVACGDRMPIDEARQASVVTVDGVSLDGATLEQLLLRAPAQVPPSTEAANVYVSAFIDAALLRRAMVRATPLTDSAMVAAALVPDAVRGQVLAALQRRAAAMPAVTDAQADSVARLGTVRVFQNLLLRIRDPRDSAGIQATLQRMSGIIDQLQGGADFADMARQFSEDTATAPGGGYLPPLGRDELPPGRLADAAWRLQPGEITQVVTSPAGLHVLRRATVAEARPGMKAWLAPRLAQRADSIWADSLAQARHLALASDATARMREMSEEPYDAGGDAPLVTWDNGGLSPDEVREWLAVTPAVERAGLPVASDSSLNILLRQLAQRELAWEAANPGGQRITTDAWEALAPQYRQTLAAMLDAYRPQLAGADSNRAVRGFMSAVVAGSIPYRPLPGALGGVLRRDATVTINRRAIDAIVAQVTSARQRAGDSSRTAPAAPASDSAP